MNYNEIKRMKARYYSFKVIFIENGKETFKTVFAKTFGEAEQTILMSENEREIKEVIKL